MGKFVQKIKDRKTFSTRFRENVKNVWSAKKKKKKKKKKQQQQQEAFGERRHLHVCDLWHVIVTF